MNILNYKPAYVKLLKPITTLNQLADAGLINMQDLVDLKDKHGVPFPILTTEYYLSLIDKNDVNDPIRQIVVPKREELEVYYNQKSSSQPIDGSSFDTSGEESNIKAPGLQHKYQSTALALISNVCAGLCRECFRKRLFFEGNNSYDEATFPNIQALDYLASHKEINTVLLSGGDALMLTDDSLGQILNMLDDDRFNHIQTIRLGSKVHAFFPERITDNLISLLKNYEEKTGKIIQMSTHFEHVNELSPVCIASLKKLHSEGIMLYNQTVLLKGINDSVSALCDLFTKLASCGVRPYYLFQCRPVVGSLHQQVSLKEGIRIYNELSRSLTSLHKPFYSMSTHIGKLLIIGFSPDNPDIIILRKHSAKDISTTGDILLYDVKKNNPYWYYS